MKIICLLLHSYSHHHPYPQSLTEGGVANTMWMGLIIKRPIVLCKSSCGLFLTLCYRCSPHAISQLVLMSSRPAPARGWLALIGSVIDKIGKLEDWEIAWPRLTDTRGQLVTSIMWCQMSRSLVTRDPGQGVAPVLSSSALATCPGHLWHGECLMGPHTWSLWANDTIVSHLVPVTFAHCIVAHHNSNVNSLVQSCSHRWNYMASIMGGEFLKTSIQRHFFHQKFRSMWEISRLNFSKV